MDNKHPHASHFDEWNKLGYDRGQYLNMHKECL